MAVQSQYKDFEPTQQDVSSVLKRRQELLDQVGVIYRCPQRGLKGEVEKIYEYDALHFANAKCSVENCDEKAWYSDSLYYEKNLLCLLHAYEQHYKTWKWTMKQFAEQAWKDMCYARRLVLRPLAGNAASYSDLLLFFHAEMVEPSLLVLWALQ